MQCASSTASRSTPTSPSASRKLALDNGFGGLTPDGDYGRATVSAVRSVEITEIAKSSYMPNKVDIAEIDPDTSKHPGRFD